MSNDPHGTSWLVLIGLVFLVAALLIWVAAR